MSTPAPKSQSVQTRPVRVAEPVFDAMAEYAAATGRQQSWIATQAIAAWLKQQTDFRPAA